jgi:5-methyltetrahydropteroyltriglutamate--homocysteine methyltransferase
MRFEYERIVGAGHYLQIDAPDLAMGRHIMYRDRPDGEFLERAAVHVEVLNDALRNIPADRIRLHVCWGNYEGPHHLDIPATKIIDIVLRASASILVVEASNPRHAHDWAAWAAADIPTDKVLAPGVIDSTSNYIEDPGLVAERIGRYVDIVGPDRVIAATDCGFGTWSGYGAVDPDICWAKLAALTEGARIASGG